ncbi:MAG: AAA family ATPase [Corynebacterium sp.]|nr:AAA family ATPase [Corynebacterium sp.]
MLSFEQLKELITSHTAGDNDQFNAVVMAATAEADHVGGVENARELRSLLDGQPRHSKANIATTTKNELSTDPHFYTSSSKVTFDSLVLSPQVMEQLANIVTEYHQWDKLEELGLTPTHRLLFTGPSGTGKTLAAKALAGELNLPFCQLFLNPNPDTAIKEIQAAFTLIAHTPAVVVFRMLGKQDHTLLDELLTLPEVEASDNIIIGETTDWIPQSDTTWRYDMLVKFTCPGHEETIELVQKQLAAFNIMDGDWAQVASRINGMSHAEVLHGLQGIVKEVALKSEKGIDSEKVLEILQPQASEIPE